MSWYASVVRVCRARSSPRSRRNSPHAPGVVRGSSRDCTCVSRCSASSTRVRREQRLGGDQLRFDRFRGRRVGGLGDLVGDRQRFVGLAAARREPRADHAQRPFVPAAGVAAVGAVRLGGLPQVLRGVLVVAAHQRHLRQRVVDGAGRLVELHRAAHVERAVQHRIGAIEVADAHADLAERGERDRQAGSLAEPLVQIDGALGERERLFVAVANQRDVGLVAVDRRQHIVGLENRGHPLGLAQRRIGFVVAAGLREHDRRQRMHHAPGGACRRRRAARPRPRRCARARSPCRRPAGSTARDRSGRGRWRASRARSRPASGRGCAARWRATARRAQTRRGRAAARDSSARPGAGGRGACRGSGRGPFRPVQDPPARGTIQPA